MRKRLASDTAGTTRLEILIGFHGGILSTLLQENMPNDPHGVLVREVVCDILFQTGVDL